MKLEDKIGCLIYIIFGFVILFSISISIAGQFVTNEYVVTVTDKTVKNSKDSSKYLIFTELENGEVRVFQDTDSIIRGKFNSSDIYAEIKVGQKYKFKVYGFRIPALSRYENIVSIEKVK
jgi:hypothetical protein